MDWAIDFLIQQYIYWAIHWLPSTTFLQILQCVDWLVNYVNDWLSDRVIDSEMHQAIDLLSNELIDQFRLTEQLIHWTINWTIDLLSN